MNESDGKDSYLADLLEQANKQEAEYRDGGMTLDQLRDFYAKENARLFDGALPTVELRVGSEAEMTGCGHEEAHVRMVPRAISESLRTWTPEWLMVRASILAVGGLVLRRAVLHEMAHIACRDVPTPQHRRPGHEDFCLIGNGHDGAFLSVIERLLERGEEWAGEEIEEYAEFASRCLTELQPVFWRLLCDQAEEDDAADLPLNGWETRVLARTGKATLADLESFITGAGFWYRWLRCQHA